MSEHTDERMQLSDASLRSIVAHIAHLRAAYGEVIGDSELVEPNGEYFPDEFALDNDGVQTLLERMMTYAPLSEDLDVVLGVVQPDGEANAGGGGCGSGACGPGGGGKGQKSQTLRPAVETDDGYMAVLAASDAGDNTVLTASLARSVGRIVLFEAGEDVDPRDEGPLSELTAVACGLGTILLNGASLYKKGCGGVKRHQATFLSVEELALAVALFVRVTDAKPGKVRKHLEVTQREAFDNALSWIDDQPKLVKALADEPETLEDGVFVLEEKKGLFGKLLSRKRADEDELLPLSSGKPKASTLSEEERRRIAETKALVEEALQDS
jgi:hypothetical protein